MTVTAESAPTRPATDGVIARTGRALGRHRLRAAFVVCLAALAALGLMFQRWTEHQLSLSFTPQVAPYSELFFSNISSLPVHMKVGVVNTVSFTIVNREGTAVTYGYVVRLAGPAGARVVESGKVRIADNAHAAVNARFVPSRSHSAYTLSIRIIPAQDFIEMHGRTK